MHFERDAIQNYVSPQLYEIARKYGQIVSFCDLRWGIDTSELDETQSANKVLEVCLDEIDKSNPPMVVILGDRYGWIPEEKHVKTIAERKHLQLEDYSRSITALEIEYGALINSDRLSNTLFYFRNVDNYFPDSISIKEDEEHCRKLKELKDRIISLSHGNIKEYTISQNKDGGVDVSDFSKQLLSDLKKRFIPEWEIDMKLSQFEKDVKLHQARFEHNSKYFSAYFNEFEALCNSINQNGMYIIQGQEGIGKSTLTSYWVMHLKNTNKVVVSLIASYTPSVRNYYGIINHLYNSLKKDNSYRYDSGNQHKESFIKKRIVRMAINASKKGDRFFIVIDNVESLSKNDQDALLHFLFDLSQWVHCVISIKNVTNNTAHNINLGGLSKAEISETIETILRIENREISEKVKNAMMSHLEPKLTNKIAQTADPTKYFQEKINNPLPMFMTPLYYRFLINQLLMFNYDDYYAIVELGGTIESIISYQVSAIEKSPTNIGRIALTQINTMKNRISNDDWIFEILYLISLSKNGLRIYDIAQIEKERWNQLSFSHFISYASVFFTTGANGEYRFLDNRIRAVFSEHYSSTLELSDFVSELTAYAQGEKPSQKNLPKELERRYISYISLLDDGDVIKANEYVRICCDNKLYSELVNYIKRVNKHKSSIIHSIVAAEFIDVLTCPEYDDFLSRLIKTHVNICDDIDFIVFIIDKVIVFDTDYKLTATGRFFIEEEIMFLQKINRLFCAERNSLKNKSIGVYYKLIIRLTDLLMWGDDYRGAFDVLTKSFEIIDSVNHCTDNMCAQLTFKLNSNFLKASNASCFSKEDLEKKELLYESIVLNLTKKGSFLDANYGVYYDIARYYLQTEDPEKAVMFIEQGNGIQNRHQKKDINALMSIITCHSELMCYISKHKSISGTESLFSDRICKECKNIIDTPCFYSNDRCFNILFVSNYYEQYLETILLWRSEASDATIIKICKNLLLIKQEMMNYYRDERTIDEFIASFSIISKAISTINEKLTITDSNFFLNSIIKWIVYQKQGRIKDTVINVGGPSYDPEDNQKQYFNFILIVADKLRWNSDQLSKNLKLAKEICDECEHEINELPEWKSFYDCLGSNFDKRVKEINTFCNLANKVLSKLLQIESTM